MDQAVSAGVKPIVKERKYLSPDECHALIEAAGKHGRNGFRDKVLVRAIYRHALRVSEATGMRWTALDLDGGVMHVQRLKGSKNSVHSLDRDELRDFRKVKAQATGPHVFESELGGPLSADNVQRIVKRAGEAAGLEIPAHPHQLRHGAGFFLANEGTDLRLIQAHLGHADVRNTSLYTELSPRRLAAVRVR